MPVLTLNHLVQVRILVRQLPNYLQIERNRKGSAFAPGLGTATVLQSAGALALVRMPIMNPAAQAVGSIPRFDKKVNSYKLALVRAINDTVLSYPAAWALLFRGRLGASERSGGPAPPRTSATVGDCAPNGPTRGRRSVPPSPSKKALRDAPGGDLKARALGWTAQLANGEVVAGKE
jgi:hypothetical protein